MNGLDAIRRVSLRLRACCTLGLAVVPAGLCLFWAFTGRNAADFLGSHLPPDTPAVLTPAVRIMACAASMIPAAVVLYALAVLRRLMGLYAAGTIFAPENARAYRALGRAALLAVPARILCQTLMTLAMTLPNPPGQRILSIGLEGGDVALLFVGAVVLLVARIMEQGAALAEENALTI
jgi:hypothetical protein